MKCGFDLAKFTRILAKIGKKTVKNGGRELTFD